ncbi:NAD(P)/FAD-dependent oxidoreductase [Larkinella knui]
MLAGGLLPLLSKCRTQTAPRIVIIGAGMAGLTAAWHLEKAGFQPTLYESSARTGGRIVSAENVVAPGIITEMGGEFIDSNHSDMLAFCRAFQLPLLDLKTPAEKKLIGTDYYFGGRRIREQEIIEAFRPFAGRIQQDIDSLPESLDPNHLLVKVLDHQSIDEYLTRIGITGWLFNLISSSFTSELGLPAGDQTSLNLLVVLKTDTSNGFEIYGESDERFKVIGGNEKIVTELYKRLKSPIHTGFHLERIAPKDSGYELSFANGKQVGADFLIITLPFSVLREVDFKVDMPARKRRCIQELGYGMQSKLFIGVNERIWRPEGYSGYVLSDHIHNGWDSSQMQTGNRGPGGYSLFLGADKGKNLTISQYQQYLDGCDRVFPGMKRAANGRKGYYNWNENRLARGAYACYKVGQVSAIGNTESEKVGTIFFAGEHCSQSFQGFMNGAAETGRKAAEGILKIVQGNGRPKLETHS